jgi:hypothetical protein
MLRNTHIVADSGNAKTGRMPVTYRTADTCPRTCPFLPRTMGGNGGCYGTGRIFGSAAKYATTMSTADALSKLARAPKGSRYMRDRVVGDLVDASGGFDMPYVAAIAEVADSAGLQVFGYTHAWPIMTAGDVAAVKATGYVLNASCETAEDVSRAVSLGMPTVIAGDSWADGEVVAGRRIVTCPAQTRDDVTCASCGLCAKPDRACTVRFLIHGAAKSQAAASIVGRAA